MTGDGINDAPALRQVRAAPLSETTIQRVTAVLRAALDDCKTLKVNAAAGIELRVPKRKPIVWTPERVTRWQESGKWKPGPVMVWTPQQGDERSWKWCPGP